MKPILLITTLFILFSCSKSNITIQTWNVRLGKEKNPAKSFCDWYGDSTVKVVFNSSDPSNPAGTIYVYRLTSDTTYYWQYLKLN